MTANTIVETVADPERIQCAWCWAGVGEKCRNTGTGPRYRKTPHMARVRAAQKADSNRHCILGEREGLPILQVQVRESPHWPGQYDAVYDCPWCSERHMHGVDDGWYRRPSYRWSHCAAYTGGYWLLAEPKAVA